MVKYKICVFQLDKCKFYKVYKGNFIINKFIYTLNMYYILY